MLQVFSGSLSCAGYNDFLSLLGVGFLPMASPVGRIWLLILLLLPDWGQGPMPKTIIFMSLLLYIFIIVTSYLGLNLEFCFCLLSLHGRIFFTTWESFCPSPSPSPPPRHTQIQYRQQLFIAYSSCWRTMMYTHSRDLCSSALTLWPWKREQWKRCFEATQSSSPRLVIHRHCWPRVSPYVLRGHNHSLFSLQPCPFCPTLW